MCELLVPFITLLFNRSLVTGCFRPLLKKSGLDASDLKNYRPVSNLSFLSKLMERVVQKRLQAFLDSNELMPSQQSAYRQHHSTETAVLKVYNDLMAADSGLVSALCLLDLTAAFDTVDHDLLLLRLERQFGLRGVTLLWFRSYLSGRSYRVWFAGAAARTVHVICSFPRVQSSASDCLSCTLQSMISIFTATLMTLSSMFTVDLRKFPQLLPNWNAASQSWTIECLRTGSS